MTSIWLQYHWSAAQQPSLHCAQAPPVPSHSPPWILPDAYRSIPTACVCLRPQGIRQILRSEAKNSLALDKLHSEMNKIFDSRGSGTTQFCLLLSTSLIGRCACRCASRPSNRCSCPCCLHSPGTRQYRAKITRFDWSLAWKRTTRNGMSSDRNCLPPNSMRGAFCSRTFLHQGSFRRNQPLRKPYGSCANV